MLGYGRVGRGFSVLIIALLLAPISGAHHRPNHGRKPVSSKVGISYGARFFTDVENTAAYTKMKSIGIDVIRFDFFWQIIEPTSNNMDWTEPDRLMAGADTNGMNVIGILNGKPAWGWTNADYADFATAVVNRYPSLRMVELWNEPDIYDGGPNYLAPTDYAALVHAGSNAIKLARPQVTIGAYSASNSGGTYFDTVLAAGPFPNVNRWTSHAYQDPKYDDIYAASGGWSFHGKTKLLHDKAVAAGQDKKFWITEYGSSTTQSCITDYWCTGSNAGDVTEVQQALFIAEAIARSFDEYQFVDKLMVFTYKDGDTANDYFENFGLLRLNGTEKPAWQTLADSVYRITNKTVRVRARSR